VSGKIKFTYSKKGNARWLSHLELMQVFRRAFRRAGLSVEYSQGFHPHMKMSLGNALKVGAESEGETGEVILKSDDEIIIDNAFKRIILPEGLSITDHSIKTTS